MTMRLDRQDALIAAYSRNLGDLTRQVGELMWGANEITALSRRLDSHAARLAEVERSVIILHPLGARLDQVEYDLANHQHLP